MEEENRNSDNVCCNMEEYSGIAVAMALGLGSLILIATLYVLMRIVRERLVTYIRKNKLVDEHRELLLVPGEGEHDVSLLGCKVCHRFALIRSKLEEIRILQAYKDSKSENCKVPDDSSDVKLWKDKEKEDASNLHQQSHILDQTSPECQVPVRSQSPCFHTALTQLPQSDSDSKPLKKVDSIEEVYKKISAHDSIAAYLSMKERKNQQNESFNSNKDMSMLFFMDGMFNQDCYWGSIEEKLLDEYMEASKEQRKNLNDVVVKYWIDTVDLMSNRKFSTEVVSDKDLHFQEDMSREASHGSLHFTDTSEAGEQQKMTTQLHTLCENHEQYWPEPSKGIVGNELFHVSMCTGPCCRVQNIDMLHDKKSLSPENISDEIFNLESLFKSSDLQEYKEADEIINASNSGECNLLPVHHLSELDNVPVQATNEQVNIATDGNDNRNQSQKICTKDHDNNSSSLSCKESESVENVNECEGSLAHELDAEVDTSNIDHASSQFQDDEESWEQISSGNIDIAGVGQVLLDQTDSEEETLYFTEDYYFSKMIEESGSIEIKL